MKNIFLYQNIKKNIEVYLSQSREVESIKLQFKKKKLIKKKKTTFYIKFHFTIPWDEEETYTWLVRIESKKPIWSVKDDLRPIFKHIRGLLDKAHVKKI